MSTVYRALDETLERRVAIKLMNREVASDSDQLERFRREAHAAARLNNPHVIPIHNYGEIDGRLYVDMRLIEGRDLQEVLGNGPLDPARAVRIIVPVPPGSARVPPPPCTAPTAFEPVSATNTPPA